MTTLLLLSLIVQSGGGEWTFDVRHDHTFGACRGEWIVSNESIRYEASDEDHVRRWSYPEIESFEIVSEHEIRIHTYESHGALGLWRERAFTLELEDGSLDKELYAFLEARSPRPVRTRVVFDSASTETVSPTSPVDTGRMVQELPARHDHLFGGCQGTLAVTEDRIVFVTDHPNDSRMWRLSDLESFASTDDFDLRISTRAETFHFELKVRLNRETYRHIWNSVYAPQIQTYRRGGR